MEPKLLFLILFCLIIGLLHIIAFWRRMQPHGTAAGKTKGNAIAVWR